MAASPTESPAARLKEEGNGFFNRGEFDRALEKYTRALDLVADDADAEAVGTSPEGGLRLNLLCNRAASNLRLGNLESVIEDCGVALGIDDSSKKARFRRAEALQRLDRLDEALRDVATLCRDHPNSKEFQDKARAIRDGIARSGQEKAALLPLIGDLEGARFSDAKEKLAIVRNVCALAQRSALEAEAFCCKGGLDALVSILEIADEKEGKSTLFGKVCQAIGALGCSSSRCAALCLAFLRERLENFKFERIGSKDDISSFLRTHEDITLKAGESNGQAPVRESVQILLYVVDQVPSSLKGHAVRQMLATRIDHLWPILLESERVTIKIMLALLCDGIESRQSLLLLIGRAKEVLGMDALKKQVTVIMAGKGLADTHQAKDLSDIESALLIEALFMLMPEEGTWLLNETPAFDQVMGIAESCSGDGREDYQVMKVLSSVLSHLASNKEGQAKFAEERVQRLLGRLLVVEDPFVKANTLLVLAKIAKKEKTREEDEGIVLESLVLLRRIEEEEEETSLSFLEAATSLIEVLVFTVEESSVKDHVSGHLMAAGGRGRDTLRRLCQSAQSNLSAALTYGLSRVLEAVVADKKEAEMVPLLLADEDEDQAARRMAAEMMKRGEEAESREDGDTPERSARRKASFLQSGGVSSMSLLIRSASDTARDQMAATLFHCASQQSLRPTMVQQGALALLSKLLQDPKGKDPSAKGGTKRALLSVHALARILISVDPRLLDENQLLSFVSPLVGLVRRDYALQQFEGLLALTNLATRGLEAQEKIMSGSGFGAIEDLQFSSNAMVVRAATELMCNCVSCERVLRSIKDETRQKIWLSLAGSEEDAALALAAAGALAMASGDDGVAASVARNGNLGEVVGLASHGDPGMRHRACVTLENVCGCAKALEALALREEGEEERVRARVEGLLARAEDGPARESLERALEHLRRREG